MRLATYTEWAGEGLAVLLAVLLAGAAAGAEAKRIVFIEQGKPLAVRYTGTPWKTVGGALVGGGAGNRVYGRAAIGVGDFTVLGVLRTGQRHHQRPGDGNRTDLGPGL